MNFDQKNALIMNMPSIHLFASRIMSDIVSIAYSPNRTPGVFRTPTRVSAPLNTAVAHPCHVDAMLINI